MGSDHATDCRKCKYYYITWDKTFPYGCRVMGFKGKTLPSTVVSQSSGMKCQLFEKKETLKKTD